MTNAQSRHEHLAKFTDPPVHEEDGRGVVILDRLFDVDGCYGVGTVCTLNYDKDLQSVAKLVTHSAKFWNFLDERRTTAKKNNVCQISPRSPNQC